MLENDFSIKEKTMNEKVILITIDGMRADGFCQCGNPFVDELKKISTYTLDGGINTERIAAFADAAKM